MFQWVARIKVFVNLSVNLILVILVATEIWLIYLFAVLIQLVVISVGAQWEQEMFQKQNARQNAKWENAMSPFFMAMRQLNRPNRFHMAIIIIMAKHLDNQKVTSFLTVLFLGACPWHCMIDLYECSI